MCGSTLPLNADVSACAPSAGLAEWRTSMVFTMPRMFHKGSRGGSARVAGSPSPRSPRQVTRILSSKIKRAVSWRPRSSRRFSHGGSRIYRGPPVPPHLAVSAISADISRSGSVYVADLKSLPHAHTPRRRSMNNSLSSGKYDKTALSRSRSLPEWKTRQNDWQVLPISGPMRYNFWPLSPR